MAFYKCFSGGAGSISPTIVYSNILSYNAAGTSTWNAYTATQAGSLFITACGGAAATNANNKVAVKKNGTTIASFNLGTNKNEAIVRIETVSAGDVITFENTSASSSRFNVSGLVCTI